MDRTKTEAEQAEQETQPAVETLPASPTKQGAPRRNGQMQRKAVSDDKRAAATLAQPGAGAPRRAQAAGALQRAVGNERAGRLATITANKSSTNTSAVEVEHEMNDIGAEAGDLPAAEGGEDATLETGVSTLPILAQRSPVGSIQARILSAGETREARRKLLAFCNEIGRLEIQRVITTEQAENFRLWAERCQEEIDELGASNEAPGAQRRQLQKRARQLIAATRRLPQKLAGLRRRALHGRSTRGLHMISDFKITPPVIRVEEGDAARISFILRRPASSIDMFILSHEGGGDVATSYRFFHMKTKEPGYKVAIWNGTWMPGRHRPPQTGTYRVHISVTDRRGRTEEVFDQIRVENPNELVVHPRTGSGYALQSLHFDGSQLVLSDAHGNMVRMRAVSGLMRHHRLNREHRDYTKARYQWTKDRGPIPAGEYRILKNSVQAPSLESGSRELSYPRPEGSHKRPATAQAWGPYRVPLYPNSRGNRDGFFIHLDVSNDGTAGCIGIHPDDEGKFNNLMSLLALMPADLPVVVSYSGEQTEANEGKPR